MCVGSKGRRPFHISQVYKRHLTIWGRRRGGVSQGGALGRALGRGGGVQETFKNTKFEAANSKSKKPTIE